MSECVLWQYLEDLPGQTAPMVEWHQHLDGWPGFQNFQSRYLKLTRNHATAVDCATHCGLGCPRRVVTHAPNDIVAVFLALENEMPFDEQGVLQVRRTPDELFALLHEEIPKPGSGGMVHFPTPDGIRWSDITIQFRNGHTVTIWAGGQSGRYTYYQMGMYSKKNGDRTVQWKLLLAFADSRGEIDWSSQFATDKLKKQKQELSRRLREFFRLQEDPIEWVKGEKCYRF